MGKRINNIFNNSKPDKNFVLNFNNPEEYNLFKEKFNKALDAGKGMYFPEVKSIKSNIKFNEPNYPIHNENNENKDIILQPYLQVLLGSGEQLIDQKSKDNNTEFNISDIVILKFFHLDEKIKCVFNINLDKIDSTERGLKSFENSLYLFKHLFNENILKANTDLVSFFTFLNSNYFFFYLLDKVEKELGQRLLPDRITFEDISNNFNILLELYVYLHLKKPIRFNNINNIDIEFEHAVDEEILNVDKDKRIKIFYCDHRNYKVLEKELNLYFCNVLFNARIKSIDETTVVLDSQTTSDFYLSSCAYLNVEEQEKELERITSNKNNDESYRNAKTLENYYSKFKNKHEIKLNRTN